MFSLVLLCEKNLIKNIIFVPHNLQMRILTDRN